MSMSLTSLFMIMFLFSLFALLMQQSHLLLSLLCLEGMMLSLVLIIPSFLYSSAMLNVPTIAIILLTFGACEASLGLSIMVNMSRTFGSDMMMSLTMNKC